MGRKEADSHHLASRKDNWHGNLKWWNDFMNGNIIPEGWEENFRMSELSFYILGYVKLISCLVLPMHMGKN